jgi:hypothetical protein
MRTYRLVMGRRVRIDRSRSVQLLAFLGVLGALAMAGCTAAPGGSPVASGTGTASTTGALSATCSATADIRPSSRGLPERQGTGVGATLWALFFLSGPQLIAGTEVKVVWRMTGSGKLSITAIGPNGTTIKPVWGPEGHLGSNWNRPGSEWGTGWVFPTDGCWTFNAKRSEGSGQLVVRVAAGASSPQSVSATPTTLAGT